MAIPSSGRLLLLWASLLTLAFSGLAAAEPPSRVARLGYISGTVSFSPAGQSSWVRAVVNRPMTTGDRLWADTDSRAELQVGGAAIRLGASTSVTLLNLDDHIAQVQLSQGTLKVRVRHMGPDQTFEVDTPNLAFTLRRPGEYRIEVDPNDDATAVTVQRGEGEVYGEGASYVVTSQRGYRFYGTGLSDYEPWAAQGDDDLDRWARDRDRRGDSSASARYLSSDVVGYEDLDANGTWRADPQYGNVWTPNRVAANWTPYRDGHWAWVDPWGWTWVDDAPWGFAVSHYGRWANFNGSWGWVPGPPRERAVYAPALVAFVGGRNFQVSVSIGGSAAPAVGWFPLAPREVYQPSYPVSRGYFDNINRSNAVIAPRVITNVYNTTNVTNNNTTVINNTTNVVKTVYANQQVKGAVVAVPTQAFVQSQPVAKTAMKLSREAAVAAPVAYVANVAPVQQSVHGGAPEAAAKPPGRERAVVARSEPPQPPVPFAIQQKQLEAKPGTPIDDAQRTQLKPAGSAAASAPKVSVLATAPTPVPTALPPATPPAGKTSEARKAEAAKAHAANGEVRKPDEVNAATNPEAVKVESEKASAARAEALKTEAAQADATRAAAAKADVARADAAKAATARAEAAKVQAGQADTTKAAEAKAEAAKREAARADAAQAAAARAEAAKVQADQADTTKAAQAKANAVRADAAKVAAANAEAAKSEAVRANAARAATARAEALRTESAKAEATKAAAAKAEAATSKAARADAAKAATERAAASKAEAAQANAAKAAAARAEASRAEAARAEAARAASTRPAAPSPPASGHGLAP